MITKQLCIRIKTDTKHGEFNDAIYLSLEDYEKKTDEELELLAQERIDNWVATVDTMKEALEKEPTKEELQKASTDLTSELTIINAKLALKG